MTCIGRTRIFTSARPLALMLYYLAVLFGVLVLHGRDAISTAGFIYQAF